MFLYMYNMLLESYLKRSKKARQMVNTCLAVYLDFDRTTNGTTSATNLNVNAAPYSRLTRRL